MRKDTAMSVRCEYHRQVVDALATCSELIFNTHAPHVNRLLQCQIVRELSPNFFDRSLKMCVCRGQFRSARRIS